MKETLEMIKLICEVSEIVGANVVVVVGAIWGKPSDRGRSRKDINSQEKCKSHRTGFDSPSLHQPSPEYRGFFDNERSILMKSEFPEKAYETFINHELLTKGYMIYLPSQIKEEALGYDARLQKFRGKKFKAVALQYKIVSKYERIPKFFNSPCFKFDLHRNENQYKQHNIMVKRNTHSKSKVLALYCVPRFVDYQLLYTYLKAGTILDHSQLLKPIHAVDNSQRHHVKFDDTHAYQFSNEPRAVEMCTLESIFEEQEPLYYDDFIEGNYRNETSFIKGLNEYLKASRSVLILKDLDN